MKIARLSAIFATVALLSGQGAAQSVVINETFDTYNSTEDLVAKWAMVPSSAPPAGVTPVNGASIISSTGNNPYNRPDIQGNAAEFDGSSTGGQYSVNKWTTPFTLMPTVSQSVKLSFDMYEPTGTTPVTGGYKVTVGMRGAGNVNLFEMGIHNSNPTPFIPFGFRIVGMGQDNATSGLTAGGYGAFPLEAGKRTTPQVGAGWHRYEAVFSPTSVTISIDLYRDGLNNTIPAPAAGVGTPGVDASVTIPINMNVAGFSDIRFGIPSATGSSAAVPALDNIKLETIAVGPPPGNNSDFNGDNIVDGKDFLIWQRGFGAAGTAATGDANNDTLVNADDLAIWKTQFGTDPTPVAVAVSAVPEPTTLALAGVALVGTLAAARRRK